jgi:hypothetical protein
MTPTILLKDIVVAMRQLQPPLLDLVPLPIFDYQHEHIFVLDRILFTQVLAIALRLSLGGLFEMVYKHFSGCLILEGPSSRFLKLFQAVTTIARGISVC